MNIGVICPADIAVRRFLPSLSELDCFLFGGVAVNSYEERFSDATIDLQHATEIIENGREKAKDIINTYGGEMFNSYEEIINSDKIDAIYIPLPPALHFYWAKKALEKGKHVLIEKPATISYADTNSIISLARERKLALHENYMFLFHNQIKEIDNIIRSGRIGEIRLIRISFGFPFRSEKDFRYDKKMGGGALFDAGGYTIKYAAYLLGETVKIDEAKLNYVKEYSVDLYGSGTLSNDNGTVAQISFGMDNEYKCELEIWGNKGTLYTNRVLTAPAGYKPTCILTSKGKQEIIDLPEDNSFKKSISYFWRCIQENKTREEAYQSIAKQNEMVFSFMKKAEQHFE